MGKRVLSAIAIMVTWVGFDGSGNIGSIARAHQVVGNECWVTGGGFIDLDGAKATFGFNGVAPHSELITGHITAVNHETQTAFFCRVDTLTCNCTPGEGETGAGSQGAAQLQGTLFQLGNGGPEAIGSCSVTVVDFGEPGSGPNAVGPDTIAFDVFPDTGIPLQTAIPLDGGNVQIHGCLGPGAGR